MFRAAITSAFAVYEHFLQTKTAWLSRFFLSTCPHRPHVWLVYWERERVWSKEERFTACVTRVVGRSFNGFPNYSPACRINQRPKVAAIPRVSSTVPCWSSGVSNDNATPAFNG